MRKKEGLVVIEDINFFEWPTWLLDEKSKKREHAVKDSFTMASATSLPTQFDRKVLSNVLSFIVKNGKIVGQEVTTTRYAIATMIHNRKIKDSYTIDRVYEALEKYKCTTFFFHGVFYSDKNRTRRTFSYIDDVILDEETKELYIKFNQQFLKMLQESRYIKYLDLKVYNSLKFPISNRLYEILGKSLEYNPSWSIGLQNLAEKMTLQKRSRVTTYYASDVLAKIKPGIDEINQKSPFNFEFVYSKENDVITFKRIKKLKTSTQVIPAKKAGMKKSKPEVEPVSKNTSEECIMYFKTLPVSEQELILKDIKRQPFLQYLANDNQRIFAYMTNNKQWPS